MLTMFEVPQEQFELVIPQDVLPWPADRCERVSVNSFGVGGTNGHVDQTPPIPLLVKEFNGWS